MANHSIATPREFLDIDLIIYFIIKQHGLYNTKFCNYYLTTSPLLSSQAWDSPQETLQQLYLLTDRKYRMIGLSYKQKCNNFGYLSIQV